jgi:hypothetical protein
MKSPKKIKNIRVNRNIPLEKIPVGCFLVFNDGRKEFVKQVDVLACRLYTERVETDRGWRTINQIGYHLNTDYGDPNILSPSAQGEVYDYKKVRI